MADKRKFCATICVKSDTNSTRHELAPAKDYGGPQGSYRVRIGRKWVGDPEGGRRFFDRVALAMLLVAEVTGCLEPPMPVPSIPYPSRVSVKLWSRSGLRYVGSWTNTEPIQDATGQWVVNVSVGGKRVFVPIEDVIVHEDRRNGKK